MDLTHSILYNLYNPNIMSCLEKPGCLLVCVVGFYNLPYWVSSKACPPRRQILAGLRSDSIFVNSRPVRQALLRLVQQALLRQVMWPCHMQGWAFSGFDTHSPNRIFGEKSLQIGGGPQFFWPTIYVISCARPGVWTKQVLDWIFNDFISQYQ